MDISEAFYVSVTPEIKWIVDHLSTTIVWVVWNERNERIFENKAREDHAIILEIQEDIFVRTRT